MDKKSKITIITSIMALAIVTIIVTYAYFSARITGIESASTLSLTAGTMGIQYSEGNEQVSLSNIYPKADPWITKTFTLTGNNTTNQNMEYEVGLNIITNTFKGGQLSFSLEVGNGNVGTNMIPVINKSITKTSGTMLIGSGSFPGPVTNGTQTYTLKIYFKDTGKDQNVNQGAVFNAKITVGEKGTIASVNECTLTEPVYDINYENCMANASNIYTQPDFLRVQESYCLGNNVNIAVPGAEIRTSISRDVNKPSTLESLISYGIIENVTYTEQPLVEGDEYVNGQYTYRYKQRYDFKAGWENISGDGWGVMLTDTIENEGESTDAVTTKLCTFINGKPIVLMNSMFWGSQATSIDLSSFDTSHVTDMSGMFSHTTTAYLDLSTFDTSNVTNMATMFAYSHATTLDLSSFDTSSVTYMSSMFNGSAATTLDLSSFDTSNVTDMSAMFQGSAATTLDLSTFDTSNVINMLGMFSGSAATIGYARIQEDADRFNNVAGSLSNGSDPDTYIPDTLRFVVK